MPVERLRAVLERLRLLHWPTVAAALLLYLIGVASVFEAEVFEERGFRSTSAFRQIVWGGLAVCVALAVMTPHYRIFERLAYPLYGLGLALLLAVFFFGVLKNHARRWIDLQFMLLQPSEPMKIALILAVARTLRYPHLGRAPAFATAAALVIVPFALVVRQPDLGTAMLLLPIPAVLLFLSGIRWRALAACALVAMIAAPVAYFAALEPYQRKRIVSFLDQSVDRDGAGFQLSRSLAAIGSGQGAGLRDRDQLSYLLSRVPERQTDFVFSVIGARGGFVASTVVVLLFAVLVISLLRIAYRTREPFGRLVAAGVAVMIGMQAFLNLAMTVGFAPITGIPLPFVSYGGSSLLTNAVALGIALNVSMRPTRTLALEELRS